MGKNIIDEVGTKALAEEVIKNGVGNAMKERDALCNAEREVQYIYSVAGHNMWIQVIYHHQEY